MIRSAFHSKPMRLLLLLLTTASLLVAGGRAAIAEDNTAITVLQQTTVAAAGATNSADLVNYQWQGVLLTVDITTIAGTSPTLTVKVQEKDLTSAKYVDLTGCTTAALAAQATTTLLCYPGATTGATTVANTPVPRNWRVVSTAGGTPTNITWTIGAQGIR